MRACAKGANFGESPFHALRCIRGRGSLPAPDSLPPVAPAIGPCGAQRIAAALVLVYSNDNAIAQAEDLEDLAFQRDAPYLPQLVAAHPQHHLLLHGDQLQCLYAVLFPLLLAQHLHRLLAVLADKVLAYPLPEDVGGHPPLQGVEVVAAQGVQPVGQDGLDVVLGGGHASSSRASSRERGTRVRRRTRHAARAGVGGASGRSEDGSQASAGHGPPMVHRLHAGGELLAPWVPEPRDTRYT